MRALILFHQWDISDDAIDPIAIISEIVWENVEEGYVERIWQEAKEEYGVSDCPADSFRTAWVTLTGVHEMFAQPDLGEARVREAKA